MLIRCMIDPMAISYHHVPFFVALATYEALRRRGLPYLTLVAGGGLLLTAQLARQPDLLNAVYLAWSLPLGLLLGVSLLTGARLGARPPVRPLAAGT
jgi:hypothetical protein